ncbi:MAG: hypothetical protein WC695_08205 [Candidatus Omnitrophota bacterium]
MKKYFASILSFVIPAATGLWMLLVSWRKWPDKIIDSFEENSPDYVAVVDYRIQTYGYDTFCAEYGEKTLAWFDKNYTLCFTAGQKPFTGSGFGISFSRRK